MRAACLGRPPTPFYMTKKWPFPRPLKQAVPWPNQILDAMTNRRARPKRAPRLAGAWVERKPAPVTRWMNRPRRRRSPTRRLAARRKAPCRSGPSGRFVDGNNVIIDGNVYAGLVEAGLSQLRG